ncbi:MAG: sigma 54-interacting transcriptional regulator [Desulfobacterales bacterium]|jgi:transcriptional regulator with GAF, ATPase, and Fis domain
MLSNLSARFVNLSPDQVGPQIEHELENVGRLLKVDRVSVFEISENTQSLIAAHSYTKTDIDGTPAQIDFSRLTWGRQRIFNGEMVVFSHPDELPAEAGAEKEYFNSQGVRSAVVIPLPAGDSTLGLLTMAMLRHRRKWPQGLTRQFGLVAEVFANALARKRSEQALVDSKNFNQSTLDSLNFHIAVLDREGQILNVNESWRRFARENDGGSLDRIGTGINYLETCRRSSDRGDELAMKALEGIQSVLDGTREQFVLEYPCHSPVEKRWFLMRVTRFSGHQGDVIISHADITERKLAEIDLHDACVEIEELKNKLEAETAYLQEEIKLEHNFESIIGNSPVIQHVLFKVEQVGGTDTTVLVLGETGTGKELIARAIHNISWRRQQPLVKVNCAALPPNLIESELFGHEQGAFTGAQNRQIGRFEVANGSSIFLDEIGDLPLELQTKLLQVLQDGEFERLGSSRTTKVDVRVIAATNRDLETQVRKGKFREDLFYRLNVFPFTVPPLRERVDDIPLLAEFFMEKASKRLGKSVDVIPTSVMDILKNHPWPGNVRELENVIERAVINSSGPKLRLVEELKPVQRDLPTPLKTMKAIEFDHIVRVLEQTDWKISGKNSAAEILGLKRGTLIARMNKLGIRKP